MRICLVINSLGAGGAERVAANLTGEWCRTGHEVAVVTLASTVEDFYALDGAIERRALDLAGDSSGAAGAIVGNVRRVRALRRTLRDLAPDVVVSFIDQMNVVVLLASAGLGLPVVISERTDPRMRAIGRPWAALRKLVYRRAAVLVVQTAPVAEWALAVIDPERIAVLPNPIADRYLAAAPDASRARRIVALGRLVDLKGFDLLIDAFDRVAAGREDWTLEIAGEGPLETKLREQAARTRCAARIRFAGLVERSDEFLRSAEMFVLSSRVEGFPNALVEAMACGCAVIAADCPSGPAEIVDDAVDGVLVASGDAGALAAAMARLMDGDEDRRRLGRAAAKSAGRFQLEAIGRRWIGLLAGASGARVTPQAESPRFAAER
jgi:glycosyltransferase involved in cell wall biosynthesis